MAHKAWKGGMNASETVDSPGAKPDVGGSGAEAGIIVNTSKKN